MEIITEDINELSTMLNEYLEDYLGDKSLVKINLIRYGFNSRNLSFYVFFHYDENKLNSQNRNNHSIYYGTCEKEDFHIYFFGSDFELKDNDKKVNPILAVSLNSNNLKRSCIVFGRDTKDNIYLLMRIKFDVLSVHQKAVLKAYNDIKEIEGMNYINFGCFDNKIEILKNIRNFIQKIDVVKSENDFIDMKSIIIPHEYKEMIGLSDDYDEKNDNIFDIEKNNYCMCCGHEILPNVNLNSYFGQNPNKCCECYSKILISYFQSKVGGDIEDKSLFLSLVEDKEIIEFYINFLESKGFIDKTGKIIFEQDLSEYKPFYSDIPNDLLIEENLFETNEFMIKIHDKINLIEELTIHHGVFNKKFNELLSDYKLFPTDGHIIKNKLIDEIKKGNLNIDIDRRIREYVIDFTHDKNFIDIFELSNKLNKLTLKSQNELNDSFKNKLNEHYLNEEDGWEIRNQLIAEIDDLSISNVETLENRFNSLLHEKDKKHILQKINDSENELNKEFLIINQDCYLNTIVKNTDLNSLIQLINRFKKFICLDSMIFTKISPNLSKCEIIFKIKNGNVEIITDILSNNEFQNLNGDNNER